MQSTSPGLWSMPGISSRLPLQLRAPPCCCFGVLQYLDPPTLTTLILYPGIFFQTLSLLLSTALAWQAHPTPRNVSSGAVSYFSTLAPWFPAKRCCPVLGFGAFKHLALSPRRVEMSGVFWSCLKVHSKEVISSPDLLGLESSCLSLWLVASTGLLTTTNFP